MIRSISIISILLLCFSCSKGEFSTAGGLTKKSSNASRDSNAGAAYEQQGQSNHQNGDAFGDGDLGPDAFGGETQQPYNDDPNSFGFGSGKDELALKIDELPGETLSSVNFNIEGGSDGDFNDLSVCFPGSGEAFKVSDHKVIVRTDSNIEAVVKNISWDSNYKILINGNIKYGNSIRRGETKKHNLDVKLGDQISVQFLNQSIDSLRGEFMSGNNRQGTRFEERCRNSGG